MANNAPYTIGRNIRVVVLWQGVRYDLSDITGFTSMQEVKNQRVDPLNSLPLEFNTPSGWRFTITVDRGNSVVDDLFAAIEAAFWNAGTIGSGTVYTYITETDDSLSTYEYSGTSLRLSQAGNFATEAVVRQTIEGFASVRTKI